MDGIACIDGVLFALEDARVSLLDRGFLYGDAVFEALRTFGRKPDALDQHLRRLERSCGILGFSLGVPFEVLEREVHEVIARIEAEEVYIRIMVSRGTQPEGLAPRGAGTPLRVVLARGLKPPALDHVHQVTLLSCVAPPSRLWAGAKPSAYINNLLAIGQAQDAGADDALLLGAHGEILEGATSSAFVVTAQGEVLTPPVSLGILPGITRDRVIACAERAGHPVRERLLTIHDAYRAHEMFMTSSIRGIVAVKSVDSVALRGPACPGPVTRRIFEAYRDQVHTA